MIVGIDKKFYTLLLSLFCFAGAAFADNVPVPDKNNGAYTLTKVDFKGENTITKFEMVNGVMTPVYYRVDLAKTVYGEGPNTGYLNWENSYNGNGLEPSYVKEGANSITVKFDKSSDPRQPVRNGDELSSIDGTFLGFNENVVMNSQNGKIDTITADFIANYSGNSDGAVVNSGYIDSINSVFIDNRAGSEDSYSAKGGAISNGYRAVVESLLFDSYDRPVINTIQGVFIGNRAEADDGQAAGGAIYNEGVIGSISADFVGNHAYGYDSAMGGAISNFFGAMISSINGGFVGNEAISESDSMGGAILNVKSYIGSITGEFIGNKSQGYNITLGGAIGNIHLMAERSTLSDSFEYGIQSINADFIENQALSLGESAAGGAIFNYGTIGEIKGNFIGNTAVVESQPVNRNAVPTTYMHYNHGTSKIFNRYPYASGGAIANMGGIDKISGNFVENKAISVGTAIGGAIESFAEIESFQRIFDNGYIVTNVENSNNSKPLNIENSTFYNNSAYAESEKYGNSYYDPAFASGGAVASVANYENYYTTNYDFDYVKEDLISEEYDLTGMSDKEILDLYVSYLNEHRYGNDYYTADNVLFENKISNSHFEGNTAIANGNKYSAAFGGAIYSEINEVSIQNVPASLSLDSSSNIETSKDSLASLEITNSSFINNSAQSPKGIAKGGAIYSQGNLTINADNGVSLFKGNKTISKDGIESNAIYMASTIDYWSNEEHSLDSLPPQYNYEIKTAVLNLNAKNNGVIQIDDKISGGAVNLQYSPSIPATFDESDTYKQPVNLDDIPFIETPETAYDLNINGDSTGKVILNNDIINANISLDNTNLYLATRDDVLNQSQSLTLNSGSLSMINNQTGSIHIPTLNLNGNTNFSADVNLAQAKMDRITADNYNISQNTNINVNYLNLLNDSNQDKTTILFADKELANNVQYTGASPVAYSPIYKYDVSYQIQQDSSNPESPLGYFVFSRGSASNPDSYNPSVLAPSVATQAGAYTTQLQTFNYAFQHSDNFMSVPYLERVAIKNAGKYALSPTGDATDVGTFSPLLTKQENAGFWVKPYASFENIPLKNGPKVSNINYGTLIGYDSNLKTISHGFERVLTGYIGYNGASQRYQGVDAYQNGGILGTTATIYKNNFFNATTVSVGATAGDAKSMYGTENYTMLLAGIGNKTGYNFEFKEGRLILQPSMLISYTFVNTFDYNNAAGLRIKSDPLNAIQLAPGIKLIGNTKNGWQPYLGVSMVWNLLDKSKVTADDVRLPEMSIKPYVQYGLGVQKRVKDSFLAYGQAMIHNGGRNGVSLSCGLRWTVGKRK